MQGNSKGFSCNASLCLPLRELLLCPPPGRRSAPPHGIAMQDVKITHSGMDGGAAEAAKALAEAEEDLRILRKLCESGAVLALGQGMDMGVIMRGSHDATPQRTAIVKSHFVQRLAQKQWVLCERAGKITRCHITAAGRAALWQLLAHKENLAQNHLWHSDVPRSHSAISDNGGVSSPSEPMGPIPSQTRRRCFSTSETPLRMLARRRDKMGTPFLSTEQVAAGERLREDFELSRMQPPKSQHRPDPITAARARLDAALDTLGDGLADVALHCCCHLEGLEQVEKRFGWSARSGKVVLRIALTQLRKHYLDSADNVSPLIG